jgi:hypothetical protein
VHQVGDQTKERHLNMFRTSSCPSTGATTTAVAASDLLLERGDSSAVGSGRAGRPDHEERTPFLTGAQDSHQQTVTIPEAAHIQLRRGPPDDEQG